MEAGGVHSRCRCGSVGKPGLLSVGGAVRQLVGGVGPVFALMAGHSDRLCPVDCGWA